MRSLDRIRTSESQVAFATPFSNSSPKDWRRPVTPAKWSICMPSDFDPVFRMQDFASYVHESIPLEILEDMNLKKYVLDAAGGPIRRFVAARWLRDKDSVAVAKFIHAHRPQGCYCPVGESEKCPGAGLHCAHVLAALSSDPEGVVRTGLLLRRCLCSNSCGLGRGSQRSSAIAST